MSQITDIYKDYEKNASYYRVTSRTFEASKRVPVASKERIGLVRIVDNEANPYRMPKRKSKK